MVEPNVLKNTYLTNGLSDAELDTLAKLAEVKLFNHGHLLARYGESAEEMYVILGGEVRVTTNDNDTLAKISAGHVVGEIALVDARPRAANVVAAANVSVAAFNLKALRQAMLADKNLGFHLLANISQVLATRLREADAMIDHLSDKAEDVWSRSLG